MEDDVIKDDELEREREGGPTDDTLDEEGHKKPKSLLDDENVVSADDIEEEELDVEEPFDDVNET